MLGNPTLVAASAALLLFAAVVLLAFGVSRFAVNTSFLRRLQQAVTPLKPAEPRKQSLPIKLDSARKLRKMLEPLSRMSLPEDGWQNDKTRLRFMRAGLRFENHYPIYLACKTGFSIIVPIILGIGLFFGSMEVAPASIILYCVIVAAMGYYGPDLFINKRIEARSNEMRDTLPDVLDLLVICTESGVGIEHAISRVSSEIARRSTMVAAEFQLVTLEIRGGAGRTAALHNLSLRVDLEDLTKLAAMLIQAERFGTGIAAALRVQAGLMRVRRMQRAEEIAVKVPTKILIPLVLCIFPALLIVILGPASMQISAMMAN